MFAMLFMGLSPSHKGGADGLSGQIDVAAVSLNPTDSQIASVRYAGLSLMQVRPGTRPALSSVVQEEMSCDGRRRDAFGEVWRIVV